MTEKEEKTEFVKWFSELSNKDILIAGGKGASLAEMYNSGFPVPPGFIVNTNAYSFFMQEAGIAGKINELLDIDVENTDILEEKAGEVRELIEESQMPEELKSQIIEAYEVLDVSQETMQNARGSALEILRKSMEPPFVAVRSSATTEDLADASFAGQQETFLNVKGKAELIRKVKSCFASLFTARAIYYRTKKGFRHEDAKLAVVVQKMIDSEKSGVMFSKNPVSDDDNVIIEAVWGLGEGIVSGMIKPDLYKISSDLADFRVLELKVSEKKLAIVRDSSGNNKAIELNEPRRRRQVLNEREMKLLAQYAKKLEEHYMKPQDIEYAIAGEEIYIVQSRPITTSYKVLESEVSGKEILSGLGASPGISSGKVKIVNSMADLKKIEKGDVLVTEMTNPDMVVSMQKAAAIITDEGGLTSHASIVSREMGIPAVVGTEKATKELSDGMIVTVDGSRGKIYEGKGETKLQEIKPAIQTRTKLKVIVDIPEAAERASKTGLTAIGLTRLEGIIAKSGKHPLHYINNKKSSDYTSIIYHGLKKIAGHFNEMWVRTSDLRSDEFWNLEDAPKEKEGNPMLGNHGIRFSLKHPEIHKAELHAVRKIAEEFPGKSFGIMIPQVILVDEVNETKRMAEEIGMPKNVKIGIMVETPAAVQIINQLCEAGIQFISFGTNDLTQYMLAIDRNNPEVQNLFNETNPAVVSAISYVIRRCKKYGVETSICGQAGSREDMVRILISEGIDSISVNADAAERVSRIVFEIENPGRSVDSGSEAGTEDENESKDVIIEESEDYIPGDDSKNKDVPPLHEVIPVTSEMFENEGKS